MIDPIPPALLLSSDVLPGGGVLNGRRWAGEQLLKLWLDLAKGREINLVSPDPNIALHVSNLLKEWEHSNSVAVHGVVDSTPIQSIGNLFVPDPALGLWSLWRDSTAAPSSFSLIGQTHTLCTNGALTRLDQLSVENVFSWDALICSSNAGQQVVRSILEEREEQLAARAGIPAKALQGHRVQLPVIPLPMPVATLQAKLPEKEKSRHELEIPENAHVVLWMGRLSLFTKTDPAPTYKVLECAAKKLEQPLILIELGPDDTQEQADHFEKLRLNCKNLKFLRLGGKHPVSESIKLQALSASDIAISLVDNLQETFGQSVVEELAAGLPVVASDWDGYRDLVDHGLSGFLIKTRWAEVAKEASVPLGWQQRLGVQPYQLVAGALAQLVRIDLEAAEAAVLGLLKEPTLRRAMGRQAANQALQRFSSAVVAKAYAELFEELGHRRSIADEKWSVQKPAPMGVDLVRCFNNFATRTQKENKQEQGIASITPILSTGRIQLWELIKSAIPKDSHESLENFLAKKHGFGVHN